MNEPPDDSFPSLDEDLRLPDDEEISPAALAAGAMLASAATTAGAMLERLARARRERRGAATAEADAEPRSGSAPARPPDSADQVPVTTVRHSRPPAQFPSAPIGERPDEQQEGAVELRVSSRAPRARRPRPSARTGRLVATVLLDTVVDQIADYIENSAAVEKLVRAQLRRVLAELAQDPELTALVRAGIEKYVAELAANPSPLQPLIRAEVERYLAANKEPAAPIPVSPSFPEPAAPVSPSASDPPSTRGRGVAHVQRLDLSDDSQPIPTASLSPTAAQPRPDSPSIPTPFSTARPSPDLEPLPPSVTPFTAPVSSADLEPQLGPNPLPVPQSLGTEPAIPARRARKPRKPKPSG